MKTHRLSPALLALLFLAMPGARAQNASSALEGFAGLRWGSTEDEAKAEMRKKRGVRDGKMANARLEFFGGTFAQIAAERWVLWFQNDGLAAALVRLEPGLLRITDLHKKVMDELTAKYGAPTFTRDNPKHRLARWNLRSPKGRAAGVRIICETVVSQNRVELRYINDALGGVRPEGFGK